MLKLHKGHFKVTLSHHGSVMLLNEIKPVSRKHLIKSHIFKKFHLISDSTHIPVDS